jgi:hypothetical protein
MKFSVIENIYVEYKYIDHRAGRLAVFAAVGRIPLLYNPYSQNKFCRHCFNERLHQEKEIEEVYKN